MTETVITVQGTASEWYEAERATVSLAVSHDGPEREPVFAATTAVAANVTTALGELHEPDAGPVTRWTADRIAVWSERPWNEQGAQLPPVYHASIGISARFRDFDQLSRFVERFATTEGVTISSIAWELTEEKRRTVTTDVRGRAVADALDKAGAYARAVGLRSVAPVAIADPGMLGDGGSGGGAPFERMAFKTAAVGMADMGGGNLSFTPDRIEISASVDARFRAS